MGILDKIKKFFSEEKIDTPIKDVPESSDSITSKKQELKVKAEKQVKEFILHLKDKIIELENLDFSKRKENEKLKLVVKENFALYLEYLRKLIVDLEKPFDIPKLIVIINNFVKFSTPAFEKATFLIGEELGEAKQQINSFLKEISQLSQEYHIISEKESKINAKKMVMDKIEEIKKIQVESTSKIENCNFKIVQQKDKKK